MSILESIVETEKLAKQSGKLYYLYSRKSKKNKEQVYFISHIYWKDWLFRVYPGGRKELSRSGKEIVNNETRYYDKN